MREFTWILDVKGVESIYEAINKFSDLPPNLEPNLVVVSRGIFYEFGSLNLPTNCGSIFGIPCAWDTTYYKNEIRLIGKYYSATVFFGWNSSNANTRRKFAFPMRIMVK